MTITPTSATAASAATTPTASQTALGSLSGNLNNFLNLLVTQLQNQDPTSPMDTNAFTSQLVQYASVEQQINTNTNLTNLITATQSNTLLQSSSLVGKQVTATNDHLTLQNGQAQIHFSAPSAEPLTITVQAASGATLFRGMCQHRLATTIGHGMARTPPAIQSPTAPTKFWSTIKPASHCPPRSPAS